MLAHLYIAVSILDMTPCESFLLAKNGSSKLKQLALITFLLLEYIYIYTMPLFNPVRNLILSEIMGSFFPASNNNKSFVPHNLHEANIFYWTLYAMVLQQSIFLWNVINQNTFFLFFCMFFHPINFNQNQNLQFYLPH